MSRASRCWNGCKTGCFYFSLPYLLALYYFLTRRKK